MTTAGSAIIYNKLIIFGLLAVFLLGACSREKQLFPNHDYETRFKVNETDFKAMVDMHFKSPKTVEVGDTSIKSYGKVIILKGNSKNQNAPNQYLTYYLINMEKESDTQYAFDGLCVDENLASSSKKRNKKNGVHPVSYLGTITAMDICFDAPSLSYVLNMGPSEFMGSPDDVSISFYSNLNENEARQASPSILANYFHSDIKLYPSKYLGDWIVTFEWLILAIILLIMLIALVVGDWWSLILIPIVVYLALYTSYMVFLPVIPILLLIPVSYIPGVSNNVGFIGIVAFLIGIYLLWQVFQGSTFWNTLMMAVVWFFAIVGSYSYLFAYVYGEKYRCEHCGRKMQRNYLDEDYVAKGRDKAYNTIPTSGESKCSTVLTTSPKKNPGRICFHCKL